MGILRFILAFHVLLFHLGYANPNFVLDSDIAVSIFFIISGFYMSLILNEKYNSKKNSFYLYISNRFLRIYPMYWMILSLFVIFSVSKFFLNIGTPDNAISHYILYYDSGQSSYLITTLNFILRNITLLITTDYFWNTSKTAGYFLVQQAWTLQLEIFFYLIAPLISKLKKWPLFVFSSIYLVFYQFIVVSNSIHTTDLIISLFKYFIFFLLGLWSYKFYRFSKHLNLSKKNIIMIVLIALTFTLTFLPLTQFISQDFNNLKLTIFYLIITSSLPFFFFFSNLFMFDSKIGEFSYPIYISHFLFIKLINNIYFFKQHNTLSSITITFITIFASFILIKFIDQPLYNFRQKRVQKTPVSQSKL